MALWGKIKCMAKNWAHLRYNILIMTRLQKWIFRSPRSRRVEPDILMSIHGPYLCSFTHLQKPENILDGVDKRVHGSTGSDMNVMYIVLPCYWVMAIHHAESLMENFPSCCNWGNISPSSWLVLGWYYVCLFFMSHHLMVGFVWEISCTYTCMISYPESLDAWFIVRHTKYQSTGV